MHEWGSHLVDQALHLFGKPNCIWADLRKMREGTDVMDDFAIQLYYDEGYNGAEIPLRVMLRSSQLAKIPRKRFIVNGTHGSIEFEGFQVHPDPSNRTKQLLLNTHAPSHVHCRFRNRSWMRCPSQAKKNMTSTHMRLGTNSSM